MQTLKEDAAGGPSVFKLESGTHRLSHNLKRSSAWAEGRGWFSTRLSQQLVVTYMDRHLTPEGFNSYLRWLDQDIAEWPDDVPRVVFNDFPSPATFGSAYRKGLAEVLNRHRDKLSRITAGYAMATPSRVIRGLLSAIFWLAPPGYPTEVTDGPERAILWLSGKLPTTDGRLWVTAYLELREAHSNQVLKAV